MATVHAAAAVDRIAEHLGDEAESLLSFTCKGVPKEQLHLPGPGSRRPLASAPPTASRRCWSTSSACTPRAAGGHRLPLDPAGRPGDRALGGGLVRAQPGLLRSREHRAAGDRGRLQRASPRPSACSARCRGSYAHKIPFIVKINHNELLTYPNKFSQILFAQRRAGVGHGRGGGRRDDLLRLRGRRPRDRRDRRGLRTRARAGHGHDPLVLPAQQRRSRRTASTTTPPPT